MHIYRLLIMFGHWYRCR